MMITVSAPGKIHLIGEHSVVYNKPAIIAAIDRRCYVTAKKSNKISITSSVLEESVSFSPDEAKQFAKKAEELWKKCVIKKNFTPLFSKIKKGGENLLKAGMGKILLELNISGGAEIEIDSEVSVGSGIGSSASLSVALTKALAELYRKKLSLDGINDIAYRLEQYSHGTPSGGDNSASCYGGVIWFQKEPKNIKPVVIEKPKGFVMVYVKKPEKTTGELVQMVRNLDEKYRNERVEALGKAAEKMLVALKSKNGKKISELMNLAQKNLTELGVSCHEIDEIADAVQETGGGAKLCGAGGGGMMLCYHNDINKLKEAISDLGYAPEETELGAEGVRIEA